MPINMSFSHINLPKWTKMLVVGKKISVEQAKDIIFRTDPFFTDPSDYSGGNCNRFNTKYRKISGLSFINGLEDNENIVSDLHKKLDVLPIFYTENDWGEFFLYIWA